ncbi:MAG TPA: hypothetical protein VGL93_16020 [Streptosporangiaceae bacterium]|jgi:hypothetical protein
MTMRDVWEPQAWESRQWWRMIAVGSVFLAACALALIAWSRTTAGTLFGVFCVLFGVLGLAAVLMRRPGVVRGKPVVARIDTGTGYDDAVLFRQARVFGWCTVGACVLMAAVVFGVAGHQAYARGLPPVSGTLLGSFSVFGYLFLVLGAAMLRLVLATRFVAVTTDALVLVHWKLRARMPWDDIAEARPVAEKGLAPGGNVPRPKMTRSIALIPTPYAEAAPRFAQVIRKFGGIRFLSREIGSVPMIDIETLVAPDGLLAAVRWHLARPRTPDTLAEGYELGWPADQARTER